MALSVWARAHESLSLKINSQLQKGVFSNGQIFTESVTVTVTVTLTVNVNVTVTVTVTVTVMLL